MKIYAALMIVLLPTLALAQVNSWENSPNNWNNSPNNWNNSPNNFNSTNGVFDNSGKRIGYETTSPAGVTNLYDNKGNRMGYQPSGNQR